MSQIHCPHCGSPVMINGDRWECGYCGDFGDVSSLSDSEREKLDLEELDGLRNWIETILKATGEDADPENEEERN